MMAGRMIPHSFLMILPRIILPQLVREAVRSSSNLDREAEEVANTVVGGSPDPHAPSNESFGRKVGTLVGDLRLKFCMALERLAE